MMTLNLRLGTGLLKKHAVSSALSMLALALGIGLAGAALSLTYGILFRPLPFTDPERLVWLWSSSIRRGGGTGAVSMADFLDYRKQSVSFEQLSAFVTWPFQIAGNGEAERVAGARVTSDLPAMLGVKPALGRLFQTSEGEPGRDKVAILGDALWRRKFGGDAGIVGKMVRMGGEDYTVVGVLPPGLEFPPMSEVWTPLAMQPAEKASRRFRALRPVGRMKKSTVLPDMQVELEMIARRLEISHQGTNFDVGVKAVRLQEILGGELTASLLGVSGAAFALLVIAWTNFASLFSMSAKREFHGSDPALVASGMGNWALAVAGGGAIGGAIVTAFCLLLLRQLGPGKVMRLDDVRFDAITVCFVALAGLIAYLIAIVVSRRAVQRNAKFALEITRIVIPGEKEPSTGFEITRSVAAGVQVAVAFAAVCAAVFTAKGFAQYASVSPGFPTANLVTMQVVAPPAKYAEPAKRLSLVDVLFQKLRQVPGVEVIGGNSELALSGQTNDVLFLIEGRSPVAPGGRPSYVGQRLVTQDYFKAMGIPLIKGRLFDPDDAGKPHVVVINDVLAREYFFLDEPLGKQIVIDLGEKWTAEIVGVVGSVRHLNLGTPPARELYVSSYQRPTGGLNLIVKTRPGTDIGALKAAITSQVKSVDPEIPVAQFRTMDAVISDSLTQPRLFATVVEVAAAVALLLSVLALFALAGSIAADGGDGEPETFKFALLRGAIPSAAGLALGFGLWKLAVGSLPLVAAEVDKGGTMSALIALSVIAVVGTGALFLGVRAGAPRRN